MEKVLPTPWSTMLTLHSTAHITSTSSIADELLQGLYALLKVLPVFVVRENAVVCTRYLDHPGFHTHFGENTHQRLRVSDWCYAIGGPVNSDSGRERGCDEIEWIFSARGSFQGRGNGGANFA